MALSQSDLLRLLESLRSADGLELVRSVAERMLQEHVLRGSIGVPERKEVDTDGGVHGEVLTIGLNPAQGGGFRVGEPEPFGCRGKAGGLREEGLARRAVSQPFDGCAGQPCCHGTLTFGFSSTSGPGWASPLTETVDGTSRL